jgi:hypothetical protein
MAKGALYWRLKDEKTGKWTYKRAETTYNLMGQVILLQEEE